MAVDAWLVGQHGVDPMRIVVAGDSAGGGLTLALAVSVHDAAGKLPRFERFLRRHLATRTA